MDAETLKTFAPLLTSIGVLMVILAKIVDRLVPSSTDRLLRKIAIQTHEIHAAHLGDSAIDNEGRKKWWFPQGAGDTLSGILETQKETLLTLKGLSEKMDMGAILGEAQMIQANAMQAIAKAVSEKGPK